MKRLLFVTAVLAVCLFVSGGAALAGNPFVSRDAPKERGAEQGAEQTTNTAAVHKPDQEERAETVPAVEPARNPVRQLFSGLLPLQRRLHGELSRVMRECKSGKAGVPEVLLLFGAAFLYGLVHAVGPGHGKSVASAYFVARGGPLRHGIYMGMTTALVHAASAVAAVLVLSLFLKGAVSSGLEDAVSSISSISFLVIACIGLVMFVLALREALTGKGHHGHEYGEDVPAGKGFLRMAAVSGMIPCPGAAIVLFFALALDIPWIGVGAVAAMSLGMGTTISAAGTLALCGRGALLNRSGNKGGNKGENRGRLGRRLRLGASLAGSFLILALGLAFFWASLAG